MAPICLRVFFFLLVCFCSIAEAKAFVVLNWSPIGMTGGGVSMSPPNYTVTGGGTGIGGSSPTTDPTNDSFGFANVPVSGNVEIITQITSDASTNPYAVSGLMVRNTNNTTNAVMATVGVSPQNGCNFIQRSVVGGQATSTLGPTVTPANTWLRMVVSGATGNVAGYQSTDGVNWQLVGSCTLPLAATYYVGLDVATNTGALQATGFTYLSLMTNVPQKSSNLALWLRADAGVVYNGTIGSSPTVTKWIDQSGNGLNAVNTTANPTIIGNAGSVNSLPYIGFSGAQVLEIGPGFSNLSNGFSMIVVYNPTYVLNARIFDTGTGTTANNNVFISEVGGTSNALNVYNGTVQNPNTGIVGTNSLTTGFQSLEVYQDTAGSVSMWTNGVLDSVTSMGTYGSYTTPPPVVTRTNAAVGASANQPTATNFYTGAIAEILVYSKNLSGPERISIQNYIKSKYGVSATLTLGAPVITPPSGFYTAQQTITMTANPGSTIYYTLDGTDPVPGTSPVYNPNTPPIVTSSTTIKAICTQSGYNNSAITTAATVFDVTTNQIPKTNLLCWYRSDQGVVTSGGRVSKWLDLSKLGNHATQTVGLIQPSFSNSMFSGLPGVNFSSALPNPQFMNINANFNTLAPGLSMFVVCAPGNSVGQTLVGLGNANGTVNNIAQLYIGNPVSYVFYEGPYAMGIGPFYSQQQLIEAVQGSNVGTIYINGVAALSNPINNPTDAARTFNYLGTTNPMLGATYLNGGIAEVLIYNATLTPAQRTTVENYLMQRYSLPPAWALVTVPPPTFGIAAPATFSAPTQLVINGPANAVINYTVDGTLPTTASPQYTSPLNVASTETIRAIATINGISSTVLVGTFTVASATGDIHQYPPASTSDVSTPVVNISLPTTASP